MVETTQEGALISQENNTGNLTAEAIVDVFGGTSENENAKKDLVDRVNKNIEILSLGGVEWGVMDKDRLSTLVLSEHLENVLCISKELGLDSMGALVEVVAAFDLYGKGRLNKQCFEECLDHFGAEKLHVIFSSQVTNEDISLVANRAEERRKIIEFCTHSGLPAGYYFSLDDFFTGCENDMGSEVTYLGSYVTEIRYMIEKLGIPFEALFALKTEELASYCGLLRSLCNGARAALGINKIVDFSISKIPYELDVKDVFSLAAVMRLGAYPLFKAESLGKLKKFFSFIQHVAQLALLAGTDLLQIPDQALLQIEQRELEKKRIQRRKWHVGRNYEVVSSLAKTLSVEAPDQHFFVEGSNVGVSHMGKTNNISLLRKYLSVMKQLEHKNRGLYSIGGKVHFPESVPEEKVQAFMQKHGFNSTQFRMIHANTSILLPPTNVPEELMYIIHCLTQQGLFTGYPQLQISIPGRLPNLGGAILGSSMILLSEQYVEYTKETLSTTHNSDTGRRMVTYDAGVYDKRFAWNAPGIVGRTDVLLLTDVNLIRKAKIIGSLLSQTEYGGIFEQLGVEFIRDYCDLLAKYNMENIINAPWIYGTDNQGDLGLEEHLAALQSLTARQREDRIVYNTKKKNKGLLVFELHKLLTAYIKKIEYIQSKFIP